MKKDDFFNLLGGLLNPTANFARILKSQNLLHVGKTSNLSHDASECIESADKQVLLGISKITGFDNQRYERQNYIRLAKDHYNAENIKLILSMLSENVSKTFEAFIKNDGLISGISKFDTNSKESKDNIFALRAVSLCFADTVDVKFEPGSFRMPDIVMDVYNKSLLGKNKKTATHIKSFINLMGITEIDYMYENLIVAYNIESSFSDFSKMVAVFAQLDHSVYISDGRLVTTDIRQDEIELYLGSRKQAKDAMDELVEGTFFFDADIIETYAKTSTCVSNNIFELSDFLKQELNYNLSEYNIAELTKKIRLATKFDFYEILNDVLNDNLVFDTKNNEHDKAMFSIIVVTLLNALNDMRAYREFSLKPKELPFQFLHLANEVRDILPDGIEFDLVQLPDKQKSCHFLSEVLGNEDVGKMKKLGRNDPCPCGSGKKYKKCCGA
jgi:hypothetical protein